VPNIAFGPKISCW